MKEHNLRHVIYSLRRLWGEINLNVRYTDCERSPSSLSRRNLRRRVRPTPYSLNVANEPGPRDLPSECPGPAPGNGTRLIHLPPGSYSSFSNVSVFKHQSKRLTPFSPVLPPQSIIKWSKAQSLPSPVHIHILGSRVRSSIVALHFGFMLGCLRPAQSITFAILSVFLVVRSPAWRGVHIGEDFDTFECDLYTVNVHSSKRCSRLRDRSEK